MTTKLITAAEIAALRELEAKATPGLWAWDGTPLSDGSAEEGDIYVEDDPTMYVVTGAVHCSAMMDANDAALIAESRNALPRLLDTAEQLREALAIAMEHFGSDADHRNYIDDAARICELVGDDV